MKRWVGVGVVVAALGGVLAWGWQRLHAKDRAPGDTVEVPLSPKPKDGPPPKIVLPEKKWDFGTMDQEEDGKHVFEIGNEGSGPLTLQLAEKACGCTGLTIEDVVWTKDQKRPPAQTIEVPPGGKTHLEFAWNTEVRTALRTSTKLVTNDPAEPVIEFTVEGQVVPSVELSQRQLTVAEMRASEGASMTVDVYSRLMENLDITQIESSSDLVVATWAPMSADRLESYSAKSGYNATLQIAPGLPIGPFRVTLTIHTNSERHPKLSGEITGKAAGDVMLTPWEELNFKSVKVAEGSTLNLFVKVLSPTPVEVTIGRVVPEFLEAKLVVGQGKNFYRLQVKVPREAPGGTFRGVIELKTNHPTAELVKVPAWGNVIQ